MPLFGIYNGKPVELYELENNKGLKMSVIPYGGIIQSLEVPDRNGTADDIVLGFNTLEEYIAGSPFFGCIVGRYGNRIAGARFSLDGREYTLAKNDGENSLHGGLKGFDKVLWKGRRITAKDGEAVELKYTSRDMEEGLPGNLNVTVIYTLTPKNEVKIDYTAFTDETTIVNLTNHTYWNLAGEGTGDILDHEIMINADFYTPVDAGLIPTGIESVEGTPLDFRKPEPIGARIEEENEQLRYGGGYDHNFVLNKENPGELNLAATVYEKGTGRFMEVFTTEPGVQFYTANNLDGRLDGKSGRPYVRRSAFCLETQHYPDSPNRPDFPSVVLKPGDIYRTSTVYRLSIR